MLGILVREIGFLGSLCLWHPQIYGIRESPGLELSSEDGGW